MHSSQIQEASVGRLYRVLTDPPGAVLLLGAGASYRSGIPLAGGVVQKAARWAYAREHGRSDEDPRLLPSDWFPWLKRHPWYRAQESYAENYPAVVEHLLKPQHARREFFRKLLNPGVAPSIGYDRLAEFLYLGLLRTVLTTNFDTVLTDVRVLKRRPHHIDVVQTTSDYTKFSTSPQHPQLVYLHGSVDHYTDRNIIDEVQRLDRAMVEMLVPLLRDHPLVVVGYRGGEPSIMRHLLLESAETAHLYRHGIFWCKMRSERVEDLPIGVHGLARAIGSNFTLVDIDGFDELFDRDLWTLHLDAWGAPAAAPIAPSGSPASAPSATPSPTLDMAEVARPGLDELEWATLRARMVQYCEAIQVRVPAQVDRPWLTEQLFQTNLATRDAAGAPRLTNAGLLLFGRRPQDQLPSARVIVRAKGSPTWLAAAVGPKEAGTGQPGSNSGEMERALEGNLWAQYDGINDALGAFNRAFRLKGETSETVLPYPPLALKEVIVNALVHRDYGNADPIVIEVEPALIRVLNPGGLVDEVRRRVEPSSSIEGEIRRGRRGIKGYRNPVLADLFYGAGEMDKAGSGLSDVLKDVRDNGGDVRFGPGEDNRSFEVTIFSRTEAVDETTGTASPLTATTTRYAANILEVVEIPAVVSHAGATVRHISEVWRALPSQWLPPFLLLDERIYSFHDLNHPANPLRAVIEADEAEPLEIATFTQGEDGSRRFVRLLNLCLEDHLYARGLIVDKKRKRAYFPRSLETQARTVSYQARLRRATRTVVKARTSPRTGKVSYWEHESLGYRFELFGDTWGLLLEPGYVFTFDGRKGLLDPARVNKLSTKRAARDYNSAVHNDLSFWAWYLADGESSDFTLSVGYRPRTSPTGREAPSNDPGQCDEDDRWADVLDRRPFNAEDASPLPIPAIVLASRLPVVTVTDAELIVDGTGGQPDDDGASEALEEELERLAEETRAAGDSLSRDDEAEEALDAHRS